MGNTEVAVSILAIAGVISLTLTIIAFVAYRRRKRPVLFFMIAAFALFAVKNLFAAMSLSMNLVEHEHLEIIEALFDVVVIALLIAPYFAR